MMQSIAIMGTRVLLEDRTALMVEVTDPTAINRYAEKGMINQARLINNRRAIIQTDNTEKMGNGS